MANLKSVKAAARKAAVEALISLHFEEYQQLYAGEMAEQGYTGTTNSITTWSLTKEQTPK